LNIEYWKLKKDIVVKKVCKKVGSWQQQLAVIKSV
jgi:hypothetical protein